MTQKQCEDAGCHPELIHWGGGWVIAFTKNDHSRELFGAFSGGRNYVDLMSEDMKHNLGYEIEEQRYSREERN